MKSTLFAIFFSVGLIGNLSAQTFSPDQVDQAPLWAGCNTGECTAQKIAEFISNNIQYPPYAKDNQIADTVYMKFVVDANGNVTSTEVAQSNATMLDREARRIINSIPAMTPGVKNGQNVAVEYIVPIQFLLN
jgi:TonB family protein